MFSADDVMGILFPPRQANGQPPADAIVMYDGADKAKNGWAPWKAWDIRGWLNRLTWDLLRFKPIDAGVPASDRTIPYGLRDTITAIWWLADANHKLLLEIGDKVGVDTSGAREARAAAEPEFDTPYTEAVENYQKLMEEIAAAPPVNAPAFRLPTAAHVAIAEAVAAALNNSQG
jgi:hypothetical protein